MAKTRKRQNTVEEQKHLDPDKSGPNHELPAQEVHEDLCESDVFGSPWNFSPDKSGTGTPDKSGHSRRPLLMRLSPMYRGSLLTLQRVLILCIVVIGVMLLYGLIRSASHPASQRPQSRPSSAAAPDIIGVDHALADHTPAHPLSQTPVPMPKPSSTTPKSETQAPLIEPASLKFAETLSLQKEYDKAAAIFEQLIQNLPPGEQNEPLKEFLLLRIALCRKDAGDTEQANYMFKSLTQSRSPVVRVLSKHQLSTAFLHTQRYSEAATRTFQAIALIEAIDQSQNWVQSFQRDCWFLVAECVTRNVLSLSDADKELPPQLWSRPPAIDPFANLSEQQLRAFLQSGAEKLTTALLSPQIQKVEDSGAAPRWLVICDGAPLDELLARFAANAGLDIHWVQTANPQSTDTQNTVPKRPVSMYLPAATAQQVVTVAAGSAGLLARMDDDRNVSVFDPSSYSSLSQHIDLLAKESLSLWHRFLLTSQDDQRIPSVHFALGLLHTQIGQLTDAIAQYKLVANRFSKTSLAPYALLHSSKVKVRLKDYFGAHEDVKQLLELCPDAEFADQACLHLAGATMKAGLLDEAVGLYRKVYNLGLSAESQTASALGAGKCLYQQKDYNSAADWLVRYVTMAPDSSRKEFHEASLLLGKTNLALGKPQQALAVLQLGLKGRLSKQQYAQTASVMAQAHAQEGNLVDALELLESIPTLQLPQQEHIDLLLLKADVLRSVGLVDKAITILDKETPYLPDSQLTARVSLELGKCYIAQADFERAYKTLSDAFALAEPGPLAHQVGCHLAEVCLQLGQNSQAVSVCTKLLDYSSPGHLRDKTLDLLAQACSRQRNYDGAVLALLDRPANARNTGAQNALTNTTPETQTKAQNPSK